MAEDRTGPRAAHSTRNPRVALSAKEPGGRPRQVRHTCNTARARPAPDPAVTPYGGPRTGATRSPTTLTNAADCASGTWADVI
ncbi:hypothetical protein ACIG63_01345 [Streptomyces antimycoticus]|uniref:hypothetical protein n=1 Tax=Streptomyces antimycoticus TaxID=68175 RepID=UPI0037CDF14E